MKRNIAYFIILSILALLVYFLIFKKEDGSFSKKDAEFGVKDTSNIGKIYMANMKGLTLQLDRTETGWIVNDKFNARPEAILILLQTIAQIQVNIPVAKSMHNKVVTDISGTHTKVEIYSKKGKLLKCYYIGSPSNGYTGNFMVMKDSKIPFVVHIPGFEGFVSTRYFLDETEWKDRVVFKYNPKTIQQIKVIYPNAPDSSFTLVRKGDGDFEIKNTATSVSGFNPEIASYYFNQFKVLNSENFILDAYKKDSLLNTAAVCNITVTHIDGQERNLKVYYRPTTYRTKAQFTYEGKDIEFDMDKFYGIINQDADLVIIQNFVFGKLFVGPQFFNRQREADHNVLIDAIKEGKNNNPL